MTARRLASLGGGVLLVGLVAVPARADVDATALVRALTPTGEAVPGTPTGAPASTPPGSGTTRSLGPAGVRRVGGSTPATTGMDPPDAAPPLLATFPLLGGRIPVVVRAAVFPPGCVPLVDDLCAAHLAPGALADDGAGSAAPDGRRWPAGLDARWAPPRRPWLDRADGWVRAGIYRNATGATGRGVVVGIVDTGVDPAHPDLRHADGSTRIAWLLDLSRPPRGVHAELERAFGCGGEGGWQCAIYSAADLDTAFSNSLRGDEPGDPFGHGTHVASIAAGNGLGSDPVRFRGVAPEASIVAVRATRDGSGAMVDPDILLGLRFVFDRADAMGAPAVANLSLGSDFGPHDGSSSLERGVAAFVGERYPGRAIVVASGNSAGVYSELAPGYPGPFGIHTEVQVPAHSVSRVPVLLPLSGATARGNVYVWVGLQPGDDVRIGVDDADGGWIEPRGAGTAASFKRGGLTVSVFNRADGMGGRLDATAPAGAVVFSGSWSTTKPFALRFEGQGTARLWVQSDGVLAAGGLGAVFPRATKRSTVATPASHPDVIAVGASLNRKSWTDRAGLFYGIGGFGALADPPEDTVAYFSGMGPTAQGLVKPDLLAPGAFVAAAMGRGLDPLENGDQGMFGGATACTDGHAGCLVLDDHHAVSSGTSMAAPFVAGAIALLFERHPALTQAEVRALLQAGARRPEGAIAIPEQLGVGSLDLQGVLDAELRPDAVLAPPDGDASWLALADSVLRPDPAWRVEGWAELRSAERRLADGVEPTRLRLVAEGATVVEPLERRAPGLWRFVIAAPAGSGGSTARLTLLLDGRPLLERTLTVAVDPAATGGIYARGGCALAVPGERRARGTSGSGANGAAFIGTAALALRRHRRRRGSPARG